VSIRCGISAAGLLIVALLAADVTRCSVLRDPVSHRSIALLRAKSMLE